MADAVIVQPSIPITLAEEIRRLEKTGRTALASALLEDESVRQASAARSQHHLEQKWKKESKISFGMWATLWFTLGMLSCLSILVAAPDFIKFIGN